MIMWKGRLMQCKIFVISITFQSGQLVLDIHSVEMWWRNDKHMTRVFILKYQIKIRFQSFDERGWYLTILHYCSKHKKWSTKIKCSFSLPPVKILVLQYYYTPLQANIMSKHMKALSTKVFFRKMIIEKIVSIISFCRWIAGVMWRRDVGTVSILDCDENLPTLPTLATNR